MKLNDHQQAMLAGAEGPARRAAMEQIVEVGRFFDAEDCVAISQVHIMADPEALGASGVAISRAWQRCRLSERRVSVPTITDPRGVDFAAYRRLGQTEAMVELERRATAAFEALGLLMTNTCINYQSVIPPVMGEHMAFGDTGSSIYANSVLGRAHQFRGRPLGARCRADRLHAAVRLSISTSAAAAQRTSRSPHGRATSRNGARSVPRRPRRMQLLLGGAGAVAASTGPVTSDEIKQFGAALASFGSTPLFHMMGMTPEARVLAAVFDGPVPAASQIGRRRHRRA